MQSNKHYALSAYPLSQAFQKSLTQKVDGSIEFFQLADLRKKSPLSLVKFLFNLKADSFLLVLEDPNSQTLLPFLLIIAKFAFPKKIFVVYSNLEFSIIRSKDIIFSTFKIIKASYLVNREFHAATRKISKLADVSNNYLNIVNPQRALYLNANLWFGVKAGGSVGHVAGVVNALVRKGIAIEYAAVDRSSMLLPEVEYLQLPKLSSFGFPAEKNYYYFNNLVINELSNNIRKWDFIYQRLSIANFAGVALSLKLNIPLIIEYNGSEAWIAKNWGKGLRYHDAAVQAEALCLEQANIIVTISEVLAQELRDRGISSDKIICYPNCIDPVLFNPDNYLEESRLTLRNSHNISKNSLVFTFVGTFGEWHGVDVLAEVISELAHSEEKWLLENNIHFLLVGDGLKMQKVKEILGSYVNKSYITLTGLVPQEMAPAYLAISDVLLSPHVSNKDGSRFFGSPTKLFEYMAMGKAIIASDLEQIGEVLENSLKVNYLPSSEPDSTSSELAILCTPGSKQDIINSIKFITTNRQWRLVLGNNARKEALNKYTWEKHIEAFLNREGTIIESND